MDPIFSISRLGKPPKSAPRGVRRRWSGARHAFGPARTVGGAGRGHGFKNKPCYSPQADSGFTAIPPMRPAAVSCWLLVPGTRERRSQTGPDPVLVGRCGPDPVLVGRCENTLVVRQKASSSIRTPRGVCLFEFRVGQARIFIEFEDV